MHGGHYAAQNIHKAVTAKAILDYQPEFLQLQRYGPMIGLAVGKKAVASGPDTETISGEEVMKAYFRDDLGLTSK